MVQLNFPNIVTDDERFVKWNNYVFVVRSRYAMLCYARMERTTILLERENVIIFVQQLVTYRVMLSQIPVCPSN